MYYDSTYAHLHYPWHIHILLLLYYHGFVFVIGVVVCNFVVYYIFQYFIPLSTRVHKGTSL